MTPGPAILCPVDFSDASRGALRYGAAIAEHFRSTLIVMTATDPLLAEAAAMDSSAAQFHTATTDALRAFFSGAVDRCLKGTTVRFEAAIGDPDDAIVQTATERGAGLIVMSSHGLSGFRKMFFGSTTERVLRETSVPVLVVPGDAVSPASVTEAAMSVRRVLVPVLLPAANPHQVETAYAIAENLKAPVVLLHVIEPLRGVIPKTDPYLATVERERRLRAEHELEKLSGRLSSARTEALIAHGEPSEEIVKVARDRRAGLIVMALYATESAGPRLGSVTYRVLCAAGSPVLALPVGNFSSGAKKPTRGGSAKSPRSAKSLSKSSRNAGGTARALIGRNTRLHT